MGRLCLDDDRPQRNRAGRFERFIRIFRVYWIQRKLRLFRNVWFKRLYRDER